MCVPVPGEIDEEEFNKGITTVNAITDLTNLHNKHILDNGIAKDQHVYGDLILTPDQEKKMTSGVAGLVGRSILYSVLR